MVGRITFSRPGARGAITITIAVTWIAWIACGGAELVVVSSARISTGWFLTGRASTADGAAASLAATATGGDCVLRVKKKGEVRVE